MGQNNHKNYAFIDSQNLNLGVRSQRWTLDFYKFRKLLKDRYQVEKAYLFIGFIAENQELYTDLQKAGYICIFKPTLERKEEGKSMFKGNVDAELVLHAMIEYKNYDKALVVTGDGDFYCLIKYLRENGKLLKLIIPSQRRYSALLREFHKDIIFMNNLKTECRKERKKK